MEYLQIPAALYSLCNVLRLLVSVFDPVKEWVIGTSRGVITIRSINGVAPEEAGELEGLGKALYAVLAEYGCKDVEITSFTGKKSIGKVTVFGENDNDFTVITGKEDTAPAGVLIRATFNTANEKEAEELYIDTDILCQAIEPLIEAHGPYFDLPSFFFNGSRFSFQSLYISVPTSDVKS